MTKYSYPRLMIETKYWLKFKAHCVETQISVEQLGRKILIAYLKAKNLVPPDTSLDGEEMKKKRRELTKHNRSSEEERKQQEEDMK